jgi:peptide deformylase
MTLRTIVTLPEPVLRRKARPVTAFDQDLQTLIDDMIETMRQAPGVGLAAPQVNVPQRVIVIEYAEQPEEGEESTETEPKEVRPKLYVVVNPELGKPSPEMVTGVEGCLSIPGLVGEVERHQAVQIKGLNRRGQPVKLKADGWLARIFQHEIDHLNGVLFTDRAARVWKPEADEVDVDQEV